MFRLIFGKKKHVVICYVVVWQHAALYVVVWQHAALYVVVWQHAALYVILVPFNVASMLLHHRITYNEVFFFTEY